ncbi:MAG: GntR family transcriptional regulator [Anaerolineae bacterium]|nr:GntR family transcriptional regulator [Anaerolineae bacterium]
MRVIRSKTVAEQVNDILRERIREGVYPPGQRIPSEHHLSDEFGVSRATIRTVLAKLAVEGLILRKQGDGTYVNERIQEENTHLGHIWDFWRLIERNGYTASIDVLSMSEEVASEEDARLLAIDAGDPILLIKRLFYADEKPVILAVNMVPLAFLSVPIEQINGHLRIREMMQQYCHQEIAFAITEICSMVVNGEGSDLLKSEVGSPLLALKVAFYSSTNQPLAIGNSYFNDSILRLRLVQTWN